MFNIGQQLQKKTKEKKMDNEKRLQNYMKQKGTTNKDALSFRQKRRIRKNWKKHESS